jgi:hypothetical protein
MDPMTALKHYSLWVLGVGAALILLSLILA